MSDNSSTCPVLKWGEYTYWIYSYTDNRVAMAIVAYDSAGKVVQQWENSRGARYLWAIDVNNTAKTVTFKGQASKRIEIRWNELLPYKSENSKSPVVEEVPYSRRPAIPYVMNLDCMKGPNTFDNSSTCPVIKWGEYTYVAYSYSDNRYIAAKYPNHYYRSYNINYIKVVLIADNSANRQLKRLQNKADGD